MPARYNIASDVCDKHPRDKLAMVWESFDGSYRELAWGELQDLANRAAHLLRELGVERGDRVAVVLPPTPETAAIVFGVWKLGSILLSMSVLYGDNSMRHRLSDSGARLVVTDADNATRFADSEARDARPRQPARSEPLDRARSRRHLGRGSRAALLHVGNDWLAKGIVHAHRYILGHEEFMYSDEVADGERVHGMGEWAWAAGIAPLLGTLAARRGAVRVPARSRLDPHKQLDFLSRNEVTNVFTTPTAMRAMMAIEDAGTRYPRSSGASARPASR